MFSSIYVTHMKSSKWSKINIDKKNREKKKQNKQKHTQIVGKKTSFVSFRSLCPIVCCSINQICLFLSITTTLFLRVLLKLYQTQFSCAPNDKSNQIGWILFSPENRWEKLRLLGNFFSLSIYTVFLPDLAQPRTNRKVMPSQQKRTKSNFNLRAFTMSIWVNVEL